MMPSALGVQRAGRCTVARPGKDPKVRFPTAEDAAMGLIEARENALSRGLDTCPIAYYPCGECAVDGAFGYHLTGNPKMVTAYQGATPRR